MDKLENTLKLYDYHLPPELIAQAPARPRDAAKLMVFDRKTKKISYDRFYNLGKYLPPHCVLVFNHTKVWPARLMAQKSTGGKVELLYISHDKTLIKALGNKKLSSGTTVSLLGVRPKSLKLTVTGKVKEFYYFKPNFPVSQFVDVLKKYGKTPLPPYIKHSPLSEKQKREQYQTIFAKDGLSVAAPTASLHFTKKLINNLRQQGIAIKFVRLDVGLGTFAPLRDENLKTGKLHQEFYLIDKPTAAYLNLAKHQGRPIIAVGTTVARTLESSVGDGLKPSPTSRLSRINKLSGTTDLFIRDDYRFKFLDGLITNFHVPKSSLLMLVSALAGRKQMLDLYRHAIKKRFRFFSFGDGMLIL